MTTRMVELPVGQGRRATTAVGLARYARTVLLAGIAFSVLNGMPEYLFSVGVLAGAGGESSFASYQGMLKDILWIKAGKDILLIGMVLLATLGLMHRTMIGGRGVRVSPPLVILTLLGFPIALWSLVNVLLLAGRDGAILALAGLRAASPGILLYAVAVCAPDDVFRRRLGRTVLNVAFVVGVLGLYQATAYEHSIFAGREGWWLPIRVFSTMSLPSTYGIFMAVALYFALFEGPALIGGKFRTLLVALIGANVFLTGSGTAVLALALVVGGYLGSRSRSWQVRAVLALIVVSLLPLVFAELQVITGRERVFASLLQRGEILSRQFERLSADALLFGEGLGVGTNVARVLTVTFLPQLSLLISDSTITALLVQFGLAGVGLFYCFAGWISWRLWVSGDPWFWLVLSVLLVSLVTNIFELFPVNWVFFTVSGICLQSGASGQSAPGTPPRPSPDATHLR